MTRELSILDRQVHESLKGAGYKFLLITDVHFDDDKKISSITVKARRSLPGGTPQSCTGIDDPMITTFIDRSGMDCGLFVEPFDEFSDL